MLLLCSALYSCGHDEVVVVDSVPPSPPESISSFDPKSMVLIEELHAKSVQEPSNLKARLELAMVYHAHALWPQANEAYQQAIELDLKNAFVHHLRSLVQVAQDDLPAGMESMRRVIELEPGYAPAQYLLALKLRDSGDLEQAAEFATSALRVAEASVNQQAENQTAIDILQSARLIYALIFLDQGEPRLAAIQAKYAIETDVSNRYARFIYGTAMRQLGEGELGNRFIQLGQGAKPEWIDPWNNELYRFQVGYQVDLIRANKLISQGRAQEALATLLRQHDENPEDVAVLVALSMAYKSLGENDLAYRLGHKVIKLDPNNFEARVVLAGICQKKLALADPGDGSEIFDEGLQHAHLAIELHPTTAIGYAINADILFTKGQYGEAAELYREAARLDEKGRGLYRQAGVSFLKGQRWEEALELLQQVAILYPRDVKVLAELAEAQIGAGYLDLAQQTLAQIDAVDPSSPLASQLRASMKQLDQ